MPRFTPSPHSLPSPLSFSRCAPLRRDPALIAKAAAHLTAFIGSNDSDIRYLALDWLVPPLPLLLELPLLLCLRHCTARFVAVVAVLVLLILSFPHAPRAPTPLTLGLRPID